MARDHIWCRYDSPLTRPKSGLCSTSQLLIPPTPLAKLKRIVDVQSLRVFANCNGGATFVARFEGGAGTTHIHLPRARHKGLLRLKSRF